MDYLLCLFLLCFVLPGILGLATIEDNYFLPLTSLFSHSEDQNLRDAVACNWVDKHVHLHLKRLSVNLLNELDSTEPNTIY